VPPPARPWPRLAVVAAVAAAHGADLAVLARPAGGLAVTVTFRQ
jgi:hypothetical protein